MAVKKIMVVDDSATERHVLGELLTKNGFQVVFVEDGETAVAKSKTELPDLILMDVVMPGMNGFQATRAITQDPASRSPLASLTATIRGCSPSLTSVSVAIGVPVRPGMSYSMTGSPVASATVVKCASSPLCGGLL